MSTYNSRNVMYLRDMNEEPVFRGDWIYVTTIRVYGIVVDIQDSHLCQMESDKFTGQFECWREEFYKLPSDEVERNQKLMLIKLEEDRG